MEIRFFILISLSLMVSCSGSRELNSVSRTGLKPKEELFAKEQVNRHRMTIKTPKSELTGIMVLKFMDGEWRGSVINEFGIKAFDFVINNEKCQLKNTVSFLDKWFIRKTIESDMFFLFGSEEARKGKSLTVDDDKISLTNQKRKIEYYLHKMEK